MNKIKEFREQLGITQEELARAINTSQGAISHYELGYRDVNLKTCRDITQFFISLGLNISLDDVFPPDAA
ncbi:transcriptional regulator [Gilliamella sp. wkB108]|uniref:helix-turn-helix transcriptional regulator n=1 Tax=Gilliamella sp. wkB108 TaxID=3120256 RepID=UPI00080E8367|nr:helix-turn-helix transcriptional regulator [Gilliamella apicola]OCG24751.1 transcriptional regulator [Gilliamella apicola]